MSSHRASSIGFACIMAARRRRGARDQSLDRPASSKYEDEVTGRQQLRRLSNLVRSINKQKIDLRKFQLIDITVEAAAAKNIRVTLHVRVKIPLVDFDYEAAGLHIPKSTYLVLSKATQ